MALWAYFSTHTCEISGEALQRYRPNLMIPAAKSL